MLIKLDEAIAAVKAIEVPVGGFEDKIDAWLKAIDISAAALRALPVSDGWEDIATAPVDESILCAVAVTHNKTGASWWEMHVISIDSETGEISSDNDAGWAAGDYTHWRPLPDPPTIE